VPVRTSGGEGATCRPERRDTVHQPLLDAAFVVGYLSAMRRGEDGGTSRHGTRRRGKDRRNLRRIERRIPEAPTRKGRNG
jgi:hypothetical protein